MTRATTKLSREATVAQSQEIAERVLMPAAPGNDKEGRFKYDR